MGPITEDLVAYAIVHSESEPPLFAQLREETQQKTTSPQMLSGPLVGCVLKMLIRLSRSRDLLEVGTFTGYATLWMASALYPANGTIDTIDNEPYVLEIAKSYFQKCGYDHLIHVHQGDALTLLKTNRFAPKDFIFLDADKENYPKYLPLLLGLLKPGGILVADNVLWSGKILDPAIADAETEGIRQFNQMVKALPPSYFRCLLPVRDGLMMIQKAME
jgi:predicted O-methyltransferase YrrM